MPNWPHDNQAELIAFYGDPGKGEVSSQLVKVTPPFQMYYEGRPLNTISFHRKAAPALEAALNEIWEHYGKDQATLDTLRISHCAGTYNPRKIAGSNRWSNHAFGAAIDLDAEHNGFNTGHGTMPQPVIDAFKRQGARWGGEYHGRTDPMHFEFCQSADAVGLIDLPEADSDKDDLGNDPIPPPKHDVAPDAPVPQPWWKKAATWISGGSIGSLGAVLYDYRVAIAFAVVFLVVFVVAWPTLKKKLEAM